MSADPLSADLFVERLRSVPHHDGRLRARDIFGLAKEFAEMPPGEIDKLLDSLDHEVRIGAVSIMGQQAARKSTTPQRLQELYDLYLRRTDSINTWDLVDVSAHHVVGRYVLDRPRDVLYDLARSPRPWERRIAIYSTLFLIRAGEVDDTFALAEILADDNHKLVASTTGGMLREAGKKDRARLMRYLDEHAATAPRVLLRTAIEHLDKEQRAQYLKLRDR
jgi:3-methyladenine DNA glycosylase AlkD